MNPIHKATWSELTSAEQSEALERGFPMDVIFTVKKRYSENELKLVCYDRGTPVRNSFGIIVDVRR